MLISFSVQNYRSFAERQTISMVASVGAKRKEQFSFPSGNSFAPYVLRSACLFGPNGAGKSSLVEAFHFFRNFTISSAKDTQEGEKIDVTPFLFDQKWRHRPSEFEVVFIHSGTLYQYGFAVDEDRVWSEWLFSRPNDSETKNRTLFQREFDPSDKTYYWRINRKNVKGAKELWKNSTRDNALYLSTAIQLKSSAFNDIYHWIRTHFQIIRTPERLTPSFTAAKLKEEEWRTKILDLVRAVDIKIKSVEIHEHDAHLRDILLKLPEKTRNELVKKADGGGTISVKRLEITSYHRGTDGELVGLDFNEESDGSRVIFSLAGPWLDVLENGYTLIVDELHNSLHPLALKFLVKLFHDPKSNCTNAQLIFTSHVTSVMSKGFMHQDQVWLVEQDDAESSVLFSLSDYKVRDVSAFHKAYLDGRFGAVPKLTEFVNG